MHSVTHAEYCDCRQKFEAASRANKQFLYDFDCGTGIAAVIGETASFLGWTFPDPRNALPRWLDSIHPDDLDLFKSRLKQTVSEHKSFSMAYRVKRSAGDYAHVVDAGCLLFNNLGEPDRLIGLVCDNTEQKMTEAERIQTQRLDILGKLTSGAVHDFNNLLSVIMARAEMLLSSGYSEASNRQSVEQILSAAQCGAALTRKILSYSQLRGVDLSIVDVGRTLQSLTPVLEGLLPKRIKFVMNVGHDVGFFRGSSGLLEQIVLNLVVNSRDAVPGEGKIELDASRTEDSDLTKQNVVLKVTDNGLGMSEQIKAKVFEPFFTTKREGTGTGLGLTTVKSLVTQMEGCISVESHVGRGTKVTVSFPRSKQGHRD